MREFGEVFQEDSSRLQKPSQLLVKWMEEAGIGTKELAERTGLSDREIRFLKSGKRNFGIGSLAAICGVLNQDPEELINIADPPIDRERFRNYVLAVENTFSILRRTR